MNTLDELSVIIPWRNPEKTPGSAGKAAYNWRLNNFDWVMARYEHLLPEVEVLIGDAGGPFNRSSFINAGAASSGRKYLLIADADTIPYREALLQGLDMIDAGYGWVIPYGDADYYNSDQRSAEEILRRSPVDNIRPEEITWEHKLKSWSGQVLIERDDFEALGGFDERFQGWGYEDNAFVAMCDTMLGDHGRVRDAWTIHIWHPAPEETTWRQPNIDANRRLFESYEAARGDQDAMMRIIRGLG